MDCEARIRSCISNRTCYFQVFIYRGNTDPIIPVRKKERTKSYLLRTFKPVYNIRVSTLGEKETKTFKFRRNGTGLTFGIRARGVHGELSKMKLYYYYCKEMIHKGIKLVKTISPVVGYKEVKVNCSMNSSPTTNETALRTRCQNNGTWTIDNSTDCLCHKGFWPSNGCKREY